MNFQKHVLKKSFDFKKIILIIPIFLVVSIISVIYIKNFCNNNHTKVFYVYHYFCGLPLLMQIVLIPFFLFIIMDNEKEFLKYSIFIRFKDLKTWCNVQLLNILITSFIFTTVFNIFMWTTMIILDTKHFFMWDTLNLLIISFISQFIGWALMGVIYYILALTLQKLISSYFIEIFIIGVISLATKPLSNFHVNIDPFWSNMFFIEHLKVELIFKLPYIMSTLLNLMVCITLIVASYFICINKDFYWKE
ncbi:hypothetical protein [Clostridium novyi]|uniref:Uncharacterized protein n=6 Tax=Clostridium TaxID=1485 RepID=A0AA40M4A7_CLONO|nr:hypothetical protein [Clostridium novyi]KEI07994.1 hypothetical protein Z958_p0185 [Clostridium novyi B str. NCTC 9691]KEI11378.1 hypothetical protein Z959_p0076 [Clostridium novyi B str. ATCC 27606]